MIVITIMVPELNGLAFLWSIAPSFVAYVLTFVGIYVKRAVEIRALTIL